MTPPAPQKKKEVQFGVYINPKNGKIKTLEKSLEKEWKWELHEGQRKTSNFFGGKITFPVFKEMSAGWPVFECVGDLKNYEYLGEL